MVVFQESDRVQIRRWLGYSELYRQFYPKLENAMTAIQAVADGGQAPDDSAVTTTLGWLSNLTTLETQEVALSCQMAVLTAGTDTVRLDAAGRGLYGLRKIMRRYIGHISDILSTAIYRDVFSPPFQSPDAGFDAQNRFSDYGQ